MINIDIQQKVEQEIQLNAIYKERLDMMREMERIANNNKYIFSNPNLKINSNETTLSQNSIDNNLKINRKSKDNLKYNDECCFLNCLDFIKMIFKFFAAFILSCVCILANIFTLVYLLCAGWIFILASTCNEKCGKQCFGFTPHLYFLPPWNWMCDCLKGINQFKI